VRPASRPPDTGRGRGDDLVVATTPLSRTSEARDERMSTRHTMRKIREVLRLKNEQGCSQRQIQAATGLSKGSVTEYLRRTEKAGLTWPMAEALSEAELEARLFKQIGRNEPAGRTPIDFTWVHKDLRRTGVTLQQLCVEYQQGAVEANDGRRPYQYSQFCDLYHGWRAKLDVPMRQTHRAGEKAFIDYSGKKPSIVDPRTGEVIEVELFVMVLGASNFTYAEATMTQQLGDFVGSTIRGLEYFGAVPQMLVPDQLRSAVSGSDRYDPEINPTYFELGQHYETAIIPARPAKPRDKAKVEVGVLIAQRWILARLRNRKFFSLAALNEAIAELLEELNTRPFQKLDGCRRSAFESIDRPAMKALPTRRYELSHWKKAKVNIDYHVTFDDRHYSAPCELIGAAVYVRATRGTIEILHGGERVASHARSFGPKGTYITCEEHKPKSHRDYGKWPPARMQAWGDSIGPSVGRVVACILGRYRNPEFGFRAVLALTRDARTFGADRFDAACARALIIAGPMGPTRRSVVAILRNKLEKGPLPSDEIASVAVHHENVRGPSYFEKEDKDDCR
jgi:transposase